MNQQKINNVLALDSKERYGYLVRKVTDFETIYLIADKDEKYVMLGSEDLPVLPVWPEREFAQIFLIGEWEKHTVYEYDIHDFLDLLSHLEKEDIEINAVRHVA